MKLKAFAAAGILFFVANLTIAQEFEETKPNNTNTKNNTNQQQGGKPNNEKEFEADCSQDLEFDEDNDVVFHMK